MPARAVNHAPWCLRRRLTDLPKLCTTGGGRGRTGVASIELGAEFGAEEYRQGGQVEEP